MGRYVVGVSGASGGVLAVRLIRGFLDAGHEADVVISRAGAVSLGLELGKEWATVQGFVSHFDERVRGYAIHDVAAGIASGSCKVEGMVIMPCSMSTLAAVSTGLADNLLRRAADVAIKEGRPLVIVPREAPLSVLHLENMLRLARLGVKIVPPVPAWYTAPQTLEEIENFIVGKVLDQLHVEHDLYPVWEGKESLSR